MESNSATLDKPIKGYNFKTGSQCKAILDYLSSGRSLSPAEALTVFKCFRLAARIQELRAAGVNISMTMKRDATGSRYARYSLA